MRSVSKLNVLMRITRNFFFQAEDGIRDHCVTGVQTCALHVSIAEDRRVSDDRRVASLQNAALCYRDLNEFDRAIPVLLEAIEGFQKLGKVTEQCKSRWILAQIFIQQQRYADSLPLLQSV